MREVLKERNTRKKESYKSSKKEREMVFQDDYKIDKHLPRLIKKKKKDKIQMK